MHLDRFFHQLFFHVASFFIQKSIKILQNFDSKMHHISDRLFRRFFFEFFHFEGQLRPMFATLEPFGGVLAAEPPSFLWSFTYSEIWRGYWELRKICICMYTYSYIYIYVYIYIYMYMRDSLQTYMHALA